MNTLQDIIVESNSYFEETTLENSLSKIELVNNFLDHIIDIQKDIDNLSIHFDKGIKIFEELSWAINKGELSEEDIQSLKELRVEANKLIDTGYKEYVNLNNKFKKYASKQVKNFKNTLDDFKETCEDVLNNFDVIQSDQEFNDLETELNNL